ncbi:tripartite tricarboxylate transporter TctB family protein [Alphaproteobacteria bacterium]|jgi:putative tricarboxylic transport membrane protein|nr:tripartite tricarboxylate transporter TctB family protein [Alphaproteobacteria bacterium]MDB2697195.1 tripartite tricarboxylate transporter TctB family protein [Alphaproteobacteria bacterium]MDB3914228.1 tripartite tricarboxylate transporter TctB family protein [Alphaproteobacteria bacterium]MDC3273667.1 tripartite tricarboxylate transporter TctB family protein [Alphaproteobacteria bacterium]
MSTKKNAPSNLGALLNKKDTIIALLMIALIGFLWLETTKFEKVPDLFSNNIPPEMFPQILLIIILGMILIIPFEHIFLKKNGKNIDAGRDKPIEKSTLGTMVILSTIVASSQILGAAITIIAISIALPLYWGEKRLKVLVPYIIGFPLFVIILFNIVLGVHFEPGLLELIKN